MANSEVLDAPALTAEGETEEPAVAWVDRTAYPFTSRYAAVPGGRLHYIDEGRGDAIVFSHGTPTWSFEWRHIVAGLSPSFRCIAPDHLGFGLSERPRTADYSPEAHADRFGAFVDSLDLDRLTLVVHDFGGPIAIPYALARPERIRRLVVTNSFMWPLEEDPAMQKLVRFAGGTTMRLLYKYANASLRLITPSAYGDRSKLTPEIFDQYLAPFRDRWAREHVLWRLARALGGSSDFYRSLYERRQVLSEIPALVIWGMKDSAFKPPVLERWAQVLPRARTVRVSTAGHWPHEEAPAAVLDALGEFLGTPV